jgi:hypothetical protein
MTTTVSIAVAAAIVPARRHAGLISNQRSRMLIDSANALRAADSATARRAAAAAIPLVPETGSTIGAARSNAASVP